MQDLFDTVANHLLTQGRKSVDVNDPNLCRYRSQDGLRCAVGCLVPDAVYSEDIERLGVEYLPPSVLDAITGVQTEEKINLLRELQRVHDSVDEAEWLNELNKVAFNFGLEQVRK